MFDYFKNFNKAPDNDCNDFELQNIDEHIISSLNEQINGKITVEEIIGCVKILKNDKASRDDFIINEYINSSIDIVAPIYIKIFNCIFDTGIVLKVGY